MCGAARLACVAADSHGYETLAKILADGQPNYELFNCKGDTPPNEPTCVPYRDTYADGITATDKDGDGVPDSADNCPTIFNAVRLMDSNDVTPTASSPQPDTDGDGIGDACDPCPLASGTCISPKADDLDSDGFTNSVDNCPKVANADQSDSDGDGVGDACEVVSSITSVRNPADAAHPVASTIVEVQGAYVTAVRSSSANGFYVQDPNATTYGGLFVNSGGVVPKVSIGNVVNVTGEYIETSGVSTLLLRSFTVTDSGTSHTVTPIAIPTPTSISTKAGFEPYESMLVQLGQSYVVEREPGRAQAGLRRVHGDRHRPTSCASLPDGGAPPVACASTTSSTRRSTTPTPAPPRSRRSPGSPAARSASTRCGRAALRTSLAPDGSSREEELERQSLRADAEDEALRRRSEAQATQGRAALEVEQALVLAERAHPAPIAALGGLAGEGVEDLAFREEHRSPHVRPEEDDEHHHDEHRQGQERSEEDELQGRRCVRNEQREEPIAEQRTAGDDEQQRDERWLPQPLSERGEPQLARRDGVHLEGEPGRVVHLNQGEPRAPRW